MHTALLMTNELLELVPDHERAVGNKVYYEKELEKEANQKALRGDDGSSDVPVDTSTVSTKNTVNTSFFAAPVIHLANKHM